MRPALIMKTLAVIVSKKKLFCLLKFERSGKRLEKTLKRSDYILNTSPLISDHLEHISLIIIAKHRIAQRQRPVPSGRCNRRLTLAAPCICLQDRGDSHN